MNASELRRYLRKLDSSVQFITDRGKGGHIMVVRGNRKTMLPTHGGRKELGKGLVKKILRDLELD